MQKELVAQFKDDRTIEFVRPIAYFKNKYVGDMVRFSRKKGHKYVDAVVTPNHKMVRLKGDELNMFEAGDFFLIETGQHIPSKTNYWFPGTLATEVTKTYPRSIS